ncbi:hypothetical protein BLOT_013332 [Blomia tropicalis]|nr:hypothetical protein BLOT_013332 [Blomia tropicalis]
MEMVGFNFIIAHHLGSYLNVFSVPFSILRCFRLLHILTVQTERMIAATKNSTLPTTPAYQIIKFRYTFGNLLI